MLLALTLKNFTVIEDLSVSLNSGLNIITGETGAGKSVIVDAINIILGDKASADNIKSDKDEAQIEALFDISNNDLIKERLLESGFETSSGELLIKRVIYRNSRGRVFINGSLSTLSLLNQITEGLVDIFSQHEHQSLMKEENHLRILDDFSQLGDQTSEIKELYQEYLTVRNELEQLTDSQKDNFEKEDYLRYQLEEINNAELTPGEDSKLEEDKLKLTNQEKLRATASEAYESLYEGEKSVLGTLQNIANNFNSIGNIDSTLKDIGDAIDKGIVQLEEAVFSIREYNSQMDTDTGNLEFIEDRIHLINSLKRKYGDQIAEILRKGEVIETELNNIEHYDERVKELEDKSNKIKSRLLDLSKNLSKQRKKSSAKLTTQLEKELKEVGLKGGKFNIEFKEKELSSNGIDNITFLFSANPDEAPKSLTKVASGGELSRIMLVLKEVIARVEGGAVVIFDEADSGVGGAIAESVGEKIKNLSERYQVICITHLPQVAKFADSHLSVSKTHNKNKTQVTIKNLEGDERVIELARMIGGYNITQKTLDAAQEMLKH